MIRLRFDERLLRSLPALMYMLLSLVPIIVLSVFGETVATALQFDRQMIQEGEIWRLYTANWVHFGWHHTMMNFVGMVAIAALVFWQRHDRYWWLAMIVTPISVSLGLLAFDPTTEIYRGFSGAAYGVLVIGFILEWRYNRWVMTIALAILLGKIIHEQMPGYNVFYLQDQIGVAVAIDAHLWGVVGGVISAIVVLIRTYMRARSTSRAV